MPAAYKRLDLTERAMIEKLWGQGWSKAKIAKLLGRARSTITRELQRNHCYNGGRAKIGARNPRGKPRPGQPRCGYANRYDADNAHTKAQVRRRDVARPRKLDDRRLRRTVVTLLGKGLSPGQIAGRLQREHPGRDDLTVSHETIYKSLYSSATWAISNDIDPCLVLRSGRRRRRRRDRATQAVYRHGRRVKRFTIGHEIETRPAEVLDRAEAGHWEGDLIVGSASKSAAVTLVERTTRQTLIGALPSPRTADGVAAVVGELLLRLPEELRKTLTWDQGTEMAAHPLVTQATGTAVYFADAHSPWQRGSNENTNGLIRQVLPKGGDLSTLTQDRADAIARWLNHRPRRIHDYATPAEVMSRLLDPRAPIESDLFREIPDLVALRT